MVLGVIIDVFRENAKGLQSLLEMTLTKKQLAKIHANARKIQAEFDELKQRDGSLYEKDIEKKFTKPKSDKVIHYMTQGQKNDFYRLQKIALERLRNQRNE